MNAALETYRGEEYRRLFAAARRSLERSGGDLTRSVGVTDPAESERRAIIGITGVHRAAGAKRIEVRLDTLDERLRASTGLGLSDVLHALNGEPVRDNPAERAQLEHARRQALAILRDSPLHAAGHDWYQAWVAQLERDGTVTKLVNLDSTHLLAKAVSVLQYLGARRDDAPPIPLPVLADEITRDTKALAKGPLAHLVLRALALQAGLSAAPSRAEQVRDLWDRFGVVVDDLASRVLVLNLRATGPGLGEWLTGAALHGTPFQVTLHQLMTLPIALEPEPIFVCENPAVLRRAAQELGSACPPLICTEGQPSTAFHRLARSARRDGASLRYHGDFDWPGVEMTSQVIGRYEAKPWRMRSDDYRDAVSAEVEHLTLRGVRRSTPWDPSLAEAMSEIGVAVYEETVSDTLIEDLAHGLRAEPETDQRAR